MFHIYPHVLYIPTALSSHRRLRVAGRHGERRLEQLGRGPGLFGAAALGPAAADLRPLGASADSGQWRSAALGVSGGERFEVDIF